MGNLKIHIPLFLLAGIVMALSIWGPEQLTGYRDRAVLGEIHLEDAGDAGDAYRYSMTRNEKLYILSEAINSQILPESEQNFMTRKDAAGSEYRQIAGAYAFIVNHRGPSEKEISREAVIDVLNQGLESLKTLGVLPETVKPVEAEDYSAVLYSAIDVLEPRNNVAVWKITLAASQQNADKSNRLIDAFMDADDGGLYELYVRTELSWDEIDPDGIVKQWSGYLGLTPPVSFEASNPLMETTPCFRKYTCEGMGDENTIVTVGFYEGINELFIKISK